MNYLVRAAVIGIISSLISATSCFREDPHTFSLPVGGTPINLTFLNSYYDDYNSNLPYPAMRSDFQYSSNRFGRNFDIILAKMDISYHIDENLFDVVHATNAWSQGESMTLDAVNTEFDELGPYSFRDLEHEYFFCSSNDSGNFDIKFYYSKDHYGVFGESSLGPINSLALNTEYDDYYPTIDGEHNRLYFCSNRDNGIFNIYTTLLPDSKELPSFLQNPESSINVSINQLFSSDADDKCPFILGNLFVFTSNRLGGFGGFDLWYSKYEGESWSAPKNFGPEINSVSDEYRPILLDLSKKLMIFSSDRSGGEGGFDLYAIRVDI
ncbi:MAG: hypothetical protein DRI71_00090 [Bacteroidetes bacterium]|nr:MAG: hypothetical protein DRI71_00090 [Bacteroidota bacterium]